MSNIFQNLDVSKLKFVEVTCDLCGSNQFRLAQAVWFLNTEFRFVRCLNCGLIYQNPQLDELSRKHIYETIEYWEHKSINSSRPMLNYHSYTSDEPALNQTNEMRVKSILSRLKKKDRVLDLGCASGLLVQALNRAGLRATGMDISARMIAEGKKRNLNLIQANFESKWPFDERFNAITCYACLSNFSNASMVFQQIQRHLLPGGYFFFNFGDSQRLLSRILSSRLYLFRPTATLIYSQASIEKYCQNSGLEILEMKTDVQVVPFARLCGFLRIAGLLKIIKSIGLEHLYFKTKLLTGYTSCAVNKESSK